MRIAALATVSALLLACDPSAAAKRTITWEDWRNTITESCHNNADPKACASRNLAEGNGPNGTQWMRLYVLSFGWNNCAVAYLKVNTAKTEGARSALQQRFKRLFKIKKKDCDEG